MLRSTSRRYVSGTNNWDLSSDRLASESIVIFLSLVLSHSLSAQREDLQ